VLKKLAKLIIFLPIAIVLIVLSVANRHVVTVALNPFDPQDQLLSVSAPFFIFIFGALIIGMIVGSLATWFKQGKHRKKARAQSFEAERWHSEADRQKHRAEKLAAQAIVPVSSEKV
jgi:uncharacterized integral membrane protein